MKTQGILSGYKTYITVALGIAGTIAGYLTGDVSLADAFQSAMTLLSTAFIRNGVAKL